MDESRVPKDIIHCHGAFAHYIAPPGEVPSPQDQQRQSSSLQKLAGFNDAHLIELSTDMYDELQRRISASQGPLRPRSDIHWKRNDARRHVGSLPDSKFYEICRDLVTEHERRYPELKTGPTYPLADSMPMEGFRKRTAGHSTGTSISSTSKPNTSLRIDTSFEEPSLQIQSVAESSITPTKVKIFESDSEDDSGDSDSTYPTSPFSEEVKAEDANSGGMNPTSSRKPELNSKAMNSDSEKPEGMNSAPQDSDSRKPESAHSEAGIPEDANPASAPNSEVERPEAKSEGLKTESVRSESIKPESINSENVKFEDASSDLSQYVPREYTLSGSSGTKELLPVASKEETLDPKGSSQQDLSRYVPKEYSLSGSPGSRELRPRGSTYKPDDASQDLSQYVPREYSLSGSSGAQELLPVSSKEEDFEPEETQQDSVAGLESGTSDKPSRDQVNVPKPNTNVEQHPASKSDLQEVKPVVRDQESHTVIPIPESNPQEEPETISRETVSNVPVQAENEHTVQSREGKIDPQTAHSTQSPSPIPVEPHMNTRDNENALNNLREERRRLVEQLRSEAARYLAEMRELTKQHEEQIARTQKADLEAERWRHRHAKAVAELEREQQVNIERSISRSFEQPSIPLDLVSPEGKINQDQLHQFSSAISVLVATVHATPTPNQDLLQLLHYVVLAVRKLSDDKESKIKQAANQLITVVRNYTVSAGLFPRILVDAACSDIAMAVIERVKKVKIAKPTNVQSERPHDVPITKQLNEGSSKSHPTQLSNGETSSSREPASIETLRAGNQAQSKEPMVKALDVSTRETVNTNVIEGETRISKANENEAPLRDSASDSVLQMENTPNNVALEQNSSLADSEHKESSDNAPGDRNISVSREKSDPRAQTGHSEPVPRMRSPPYISHEDTYASPSDESASRVEASHKPSYQGSVRTNSYRASREETASNTAPHNNSVPHDSVPHDYSIPHNSNVSQSITAPYSNNVPPVESGHNLDSVTPTPHVDSVGGGIAHVGSADEEKVQERNPPRMPHGGNVARMGSASSGPSRENMSREKSVSRSTHHIESSPRALYQKNMSREESDSRIVHPDEGSPYEGSVSRGDSASNTRREKDLHQEHHVGRTLDKKSESHFGSEKSAPREGGLAYAERRVSSGGISRLDNTTVDKISDSPAPAVRATPNTADRYKYHPPPAGDRDVANLQKYIEEKTSGTVEAISELLSGIKSNATAEELKRVMATIQVLVGGIILNFKKTMAKTQHHMLKEKGSFLVENLEHCMARMDMLRDEELNAIREDAKPNRHLKQRLAGVSFDMAKCTKELVKTVEFAAIDIEVGDIDRMLA